MTPPARDGQAEIDLLPVGIAHVDDVGTIGLAGTQAGRLREALG